MGDRPITKPRHLFESGETTGETEEVDVEGGDDSENDDSSPSFVVMKAPNDQNDLGLDQSDGDMDEDADTSVENSSRSFDSSETPQQPSASPTSSSSSVTTSARPSSLEKSGRKNTGKEKILSSRRGKSTKRSRNEVFLSTAFEMVQKQQQAADERFFRMEAARQEKEFELEEKRRKDEQKHEFAMMQMMGNMFAGIAESFNSLYQPQPHQSFTPPTQSQNQFPLGGQSIMQTHPQQANQQDIFANGFVRSMVSEHKKDNVHYTNLS